MTLEKFFNTYLFALWVLFNVVAGMWAGTWFWYDVTTQTPHWQGLVIFACVYLILAQLHFAIFRWMVSQGEKK